MAAVADAADAAGDVVACAVRNFTKRDLTISVWSRCSSGALMYVALEEPVLKAPDGRDKQAPEELRSRRVRTSDTLSGEPTLEESGVDSAAATVDCEEEPTAEVASAVSPSAEDTVDDGGGELKRSMARARLPVHNFSHGRRCRLLLWPLGSADPAADDDEHVTDEPERNSEPGC